ncbi:MAG TPA: M61 family peptidase [Candidatus Polarisedimenticolia bacterium]|nr:M61 family peptidase [Candidatus Polarisedimenticolia bacterium]
MKPCRRLCLSLCLALLCLLSGHRPAAAKPRRAAPAAVSTPIVLQVDASEAPRKIFHARLTIPARPGPLTLLYPKWIPGEHGPSGPIADLAGLKISAGGRDIPWSRDLTDMFTFHCEVPAGASTVEATFDYLSPAALDGFSAGASATAQLAVVSWNQLLLYPKGPASDDLRYTASLRLPDGWRFGTALPIEEGEGSAGGTLRFKTVSLTTLVDSPVITGAMFRVVPLAPGTTPPHEIDMAADSEAALAMSPEQVAAHSRLVDEALTLFGATHYRDYHFLYTLSDHTAHFGLEHHESSDNRVGERTLLDDDRRRVAVTLLPHEFVHSWNGKYRRPADLATPDYQKPMESDLLWVYEGLTDYLGFVLTGRSGLESADLLRQRLADIAADMAHRPGRTWRPLVDTATSAQILYGLRPAWSSWRRGVDFYREGVLIWLEADVIIRQRTNGSRSLDDFCRRFHGGTSGGPEMVPYTTRDVYDALNAVAPYDWEKFFHDRVYVAPTEPPLGGIEGAGWRVAYAPTRTDYLKAREDVDKQVDGASSIGITVSKKNGEILDAIPGMAAADAGVAPGMRLVAVNGRAFSADVLRDALAATTRSRGGLELLVENAGYYRTYSLDYHGGDRYPILERMESRPDLLSQILKPHAAARQPAGR